MSADVTTEAAARSLRRSRVRIVRVFFMIYILESGGPGSTALVSGRIVCAILRAIRGGPLTAWNEAGDESFALAGAEAAAKAAGA